MKWRNCICLGLFYKMLDSSQGLWQLCKDRVHIKQPPKPLTAQMVKYLPEMQEAPEPGVGGGCGNPPVFLPGESPWTEEPGGLQFMGSQRVRLTLSFFKITAQSCLSPDGVASLLAPPNQCLPVRQLQSDLTYMSVSQEWNVSHMSAL